MQLLGYPMDLRSQLRRKQLRLLVAIVLFLAALLVSAPDSDEEEDDSSDVAVSPSAERLK